MKRAIPSLMVARFAPAIPLLLDTYPAKAGYSLRKIRTGATSAVRIRRSSDNAEQDIGFTGNNFDTSSFSSFIGGGSGFVKTWYDQSGNGNDVTQATTATQPELKLNIYGTIPANYFLGVFLSPQYLGVANFMGSATAGTLFMVTENDTEPPPGADGLGHPVQCAGQDVTASHYPEGDSKVKESFGSTVRNDCGDPAASLASINLYCCISAASDFRDYVNQTSLFSTGTNTVAFTTEFSIGAQYVSPGTTRIYGHKGYISEVLIYDSAISDTDRGAISTDINSYYTIY